MLHIITATFNINKISNVQGTHYIGRTNIPYTTTYFQLFSTYLSLINNSQSLTELHSL